MSWSNYLRLVLSENEVERILDDLNVSYSRQYWGWSGECDIEIDKSIYGSKSKPVLLFSGAEYSRGCGLPQRFKRNAKKKGFYKNRERGK